MSIGRWNTAGMAAPVAGSRGLRVDRSSQWNLCVQVALITTANISGATQPLWQDVTAGVIDVDWNVGDASRESRLPIGEARIRIERDLLGDAFGDPLAVRPSPDVNSRFGAGCLFRFGYYSTAAGGTWWPIMTGFVDTISEDWTADQPAFKTYGPGGSVRYGVYELECFDSLYYLAGYRQASTYSAVTGTNAWNALDVLLSACDWPFQWIVEGSPVYSSVMVTPAPYQAPLPLLHRLADTMGASLHALPDGRVTVNPWGLQLNTSPLWYVVDRNLDVGSGIAPVDRTFHVTSMRMINSMDRLLYRAEAYSPEVAGYPVQIGRSTSPVLSDRYRWRVDRPGWPMNDTLNTTHPHPWNADDNAYRAREVTRCDRVTFDTATAGKGAGQSLDSMIEFLVRYANRLQCSYQVQRRAYGSDGLFDQLCTVGQISGRITRDANQHRLTVTHGLRWW